LEKWVVYLLHGGIERVEVSVEDVVELGHGAILQDAGLTECWALLNSGLMTGSSKRVCDGDLPMKGVKSGYPAI